MATQTYTDSVTLTSAVEFNRFDSVTYLYMTGVAGTNTVTATGPANMVLTAPQAPVILVPAVTNTGATTLNITPSGGVALTAKAVFCNGIACVGGELRAGVPAILVYDGTQYQIVGPFVGGTLAAPVVGTDATDSTSITTGAFKTAGGLGVAKALWVGGLANISSNLTVGGGAAVTGNVTALGVAVTGTTNGTVSVTTSAASYVSFLMTRTVNTAASWEMYVPNGSTDLRWFAGAADRMTLTPAGNLTISGTLGVTGAATLSSTLGVTGTSTMAAINASGLVAMAGAATVGTTLSVTGTTTAAAINASGSVTLSGTSFFRSVTTSNTPGTFNYYMSASGIREGTAGDVNIDTYSGAWGARLTISQAGAVSIPGTLALGSSGMTVTGSASAWGFGVAPSAWSTGKALEVGFAGSGFNAINQTDIEYGGNVYYNSGYKFAGTGYAGQYRIIDGAHSWVASSASGTAGNTATMNTLMTLSAGGDLAVQGSVTNTQGALNFTSNSDNNVAILNASKTSAYTSQILRIRFTGYTPNTSSNYFLFMDDITAARMYVRSDGGIANYSANNVNLSDETVKSDFIPMPSFRDEFAAMQGKWTRFKYTDQTHADYNSGYRAQDIKEVFGAKAPELVDWWETEKRVEVEDAETGEKTNKMVPIPESERKLAVYNDDLHNIAMSVVSELVIEQNALRAEFAAYKAAHP